MSKLFRYRKAPEGKTNSPSDLTPSGPSAEASEAREEPVTHRRHLRNLFGLRKSEKQNQPTKEAVQTQASSWEDRSFTVGFDSNWTILF